MPEVIVVKPFLSLEDSLQASGGGSGSERIGRDQPTAEVRRLPSNTSLTANQSAPVRERSSTTLPLTAVVTPFLSPLEALKSRWLTDGGDNAEHDVSERGIPDVPSVGARRPFSHGPLSSNPLTRSKIS